MTNTLFRSTLYEREAPNMSRAASLKRGESAVSALLNQVPVHLLVEITYA
mgnify:FL=1